MKGRFAAVLPAGGLGKRMGGNIPKQLMVLGGKPVYRYSLETFLSMDEIAEVVMAVPADWRDHFEKEIFSDNASDEIRAKMKIVVGGAAGQRGGWCKQRREGGRPQPFYCLMH